MIRLIREIYLGLRVAYLRALLANIERMEPRSIERVMVEAELYAVQAARRRNALAWRLEEKL